MANKENNNWVNLFVSPRISTTQGTGVALFREEINKLVEKADEVNPEGRIVVSIFHKVERFRPIANGIGNLVFAERYYPNAIAFGNAEVAKEWSDILEHINEINKIIDKRRKIYAQSKRGRAVQNQEQKTEKSSQTIQGE